ncbi:cation transporting ATPase C-terminal domain-containing protein [Bradyrhizobium sp. JR3.5]
MILLAPDLSVLGAGVIEGRRTFANISKYVRMGTSSNFGNMLSMALASIALPFLPLLPLQILLNNLLYDLSEIGIPFDEIDEEDAERPQSWNMADILRFTFVMGSISSLFDVATFTILLKVFHTDAAAFQTGWFLESIATQILVIFLIRTAAAAMARQPTASHPGAGLAGRACFRHFPGAGTGRFLVRFRRPAAYAAGCDNFDNDQLPRHGRGRKASCSPSRCT